MAELKYRAATLGALLVLVGAGCVACADTPPAAPAIAAPPAVVAPPPITVPAVSAAALEQRLAAAPGALTLLDVRTPEEFAAGHVPGARNIPVQELAARLSELDTARNGDIVVYCRSGRRAASALQTLQARGFEHLLHLDGDMQGWSAGGHHVEVPVPTSTPAPAAEAPH
jgi:phage shock protein E